MEIVTKDGYKLNAQLFENINARATVVLSIGTASKTNFYVKFAEFIANSGYNVVLWNYRGFGESKNRSIKNSDIKYSDFGVYDIPSVIDAAKSKFPNSPLFYVGHSAGGQQLVFAENRHLVNGMVAIAVSTGYTKNMPLAYRIKANFFFKLFVPLTSRMYGYIPAKKLNLMEDLPSKVALEWRDWCSKPDYFYAKEFCGKTVPDISNMNYSFLIHVLTADDDEISTQSNVQNFWKHISSDKGIIFKSYKAKESPNRKIGHFGYFRKSNDYIWDDVVGILNSFKI